MEVWIDIPEYEGLYQISNLGRVKRLSRIVTESNGKVRHLKEKVLKGGTYPNEYKFVCLRKNNENKNVMIHRLVAQIFIPNIDNKLYVNHMDGNKFNNSFENLEWCTQSENLKHAVDIGLVENQCKVRRKVLISTINGNEILFNSIKDCAAYFNRDRSWLYSCINRHGNEFTYNNYKIKVEKSKIRKRVV